MRQHYKHQPIVATDWPPRIGKDFFGRLVLLEKEAILTDKESAWHLLRGKVDKIIKLFDNQEIDFNRILQPTESSVSLRILVDGPPGIGKTTLCHKLLNMWSNGALVHQQYDLVLYCPLRNRNRTTATTLADLFTRQLNRYKNVPQWFEERDGEGLLIIFDGWDELSEQLRQSSLAASIICREHLDRCSVIVTSRSYASSSLLDIASFDRHIQVIGLSEKEISTVIIQTIQKDAKLAQELIEENTFTDPNNKTKHYNPDLSTTQSNKESQQAVKLIQDLKVRGDVRSLCYVPLVLSMVILVYCKEGGQLPTTLTQLYENFILQTIRRHAKKHNSINPRNLGSLSSLPSQFSLALEEMCYIAFKGLDKTVMTFSFLEMQEYSVCQAVKEDYLGLMTTFIDYDEEKYQFLHLSIQEFLAAWWIAKHEKKTEEVFKDHFDDDHFRMCLRFVAGLTHLENESYQQYFIKQLSLLCIKEPLFGYEKCRLSLFYKNPEIKFFIYYMNNIISFGDVSHHFPLLLVQLLYESRNTMLCHVLAQSMSKNSLCQYTETLSLFDWLCLSYFISNSGTTWNLLHLEDSLYQKTLNVFTAGLTNDSQTSCLRLELKFHEPNTDLLQKLLSSSLLFHMQECYCQLEMGYYEPCCVLLQLLNLSQLKILHLTVFGCNPQTSESTFLTICTKLESSIKMNSTLEEMKIDLSGNYSQRTSTIACIIRGVTNNTTIKSLSLSLDLSSFASVGNFPFLPLPDGIIEQLLMVNNTLEALSLIIPDEIEPSSLNILHVNIPLTALEIGGVWQMYPFLCRSKLMTSLLPKINDLKCLILHKLHFSSSIFDSHRSLQTLCLVVDKSDDAIELFTILQTNITVQALSVTLSLKEETSKVGPSLCNMLSQNLTLQCFEIDTLLGSISFLSFLSDGIRDNIALQHLSVGYIQLCINKHINNFFTVISQKHNLRELQLKFKLGLSSNQWSPVTDEERKTKMTALFHEQLLPDVTNMLQLHKTVKLMDIHCLSLNNSFQPSWKKNILHFYDSIFIHPSLEYIEVGHPAPSGLKDILEDKRMALSERHKQEQPHKTVPVINFK